VKNEEKMQYSRVSAEEANLFTDDLPVNAAGVRLAKCSWNYAACTGSIVEDIVRRKLSIIRIP
jgi:hypothetical protein